MRRRPKGVVIISLLLVAGGLAGLLAVLWLQTTILRQTGPRLSWTGAIVGVFGCVYGFGIWVGIALWKNQKRSLFWAKLLFAAQVPILVLPGFAYRLYDGVLGAIQVTLAAGTTNVGFQFEFGSKFVFRLFSSSEEVVLGVNVAALLFLLYLLRVRPAEADLPATEDGHAIATHLPEPGKN